MLAFLGLNGLRLAADPQALTDLVTGVADGHMSKAEIAVFVKAHIRPRRRRRRGR
jgi:prophage maintenance system killer protein